MPHDVSRRRERQLSENLVLTQVALDWAPVKVPPQDRQRENLLFLEIEWYLDPSPCFPCCSPAAQRGLTLRDSSIKICTVLNLSLKSVRLLS